MVMTSLKVSTNSLILTMLLFLTRSPEVRRTWEPAVGTVLKGSVEFGSKDNLIQLRGSFPLVKR